MRKKALKRCESIRAQFYRRWFEHCGKSLCIIGERQCGKTFLVKQLETMPECVAAHFCFDAEPQSSEPATVVRSLCRQLAARFPNVFIGDACRVHADALHSAELMIISPLRLLSKVNERTFLVVDNVNSPPLVDLMTKLADELPQAIRVVISMRDECQHRLDSFHLIDMSAWIADKRLFIRQRFDKDVAQLMNSSWAFIDLLSRVNQHYDDDDDGQQPETSTHLCDSIISKLSPHAIDICKLVMTSRNIPNRHQIAAVWHLFAKRTDMIYIDTIYPIIGDEFDQFETDRFNISNLWRDYIQQKFNDNWRIYHSAWCEYYKTKRRKSAQDLVELAYHLTRSDVSEPDCQRILTSCGAHLLSLKCGVIDHATTQLLLDCGAVLDTNSTKYDVPYLCAVGDESRLSDALSQHNFDDLDIGLLMAASRGHTNVCRLIIGQYAHVFRKDLSTKFSEWNALRCAACHGQLDCLQYLVSSQHYNVDECGPSRRTALRAAAWAGQVDACRMLIDAGADVNRVDAQHRTPLMAAAYGDHFEVVELMLNNGANVNGLDESGATALHLHLSNGSKTNQHKRTTQVLLEYGASCEVSDSSQRLPLHLAAYHNDPSLDHLLTAYPSAVELTDVQGQTPLHLAASQGHEHVVEQLLAAGASVDWIDNDGRTALEWAAIGGNAETVRTLLARMSDECHRDNDGASALHYAIQHSNSVDVCRLLLNEQTINSKDRYGQTPLLLACSLDSQESVNIVELLLNNGCDVNVSSHDMRTPISVAAHYGNTRILQLLLARGCCSDEQFYTDAQPLIHSLCAEKHNESCQLLLEYHLSHGPELSTITDSYGRTVAHIAACVNNHGLLKWMSRRLSDPSMLDESRDEDGRTPLHLCVWSDSLDCARILVACCDLDRRDHNGATALIIAAHCGNAKMVELLLASGADGGLVDNDGRTARDVAKNSEIGYLIENASSPFNKG